MSDNQIKAIAIGSALGTSFRTTARVIFGDIAKGVTCGAHWTNYWSASKTFILNEKKDK